MITEALNQTMTLADGRVLGYAEAGDPEGMPLFLFHGLNSSRLEVNIAHEQMSQAGIRIIGVERPGMGLSTFQEDRKILDFVDDVIALADRLKLDIFSVLGVSAGAAYATACAYKIPHRVLFCGMISALGPVELGIDDMGRRSRAFIFVAQNFPWLIKPIFWLVQGRLSQKESIADRFLEHIMFNLGEEDHKLLVDPRIKKALLETFQESYHNGTKGVAHDARLVLGRSWGFDLQNIQLDHIYLWHGAKDLAVPVSMARSMAKEIAGSKIKVYPNEGHLSIVFHHLHEIVEDIIRDTLKRSKRNIH